MNKNTPPQFKFSQMQFPVLYSVFHTWPKEIRYDSAYKIEAVIREDRVLEIGFGINMVSLNQYEKMPEFEVTVTSSGIFEFNHDLGNFNSFKEIPLCANYLALMYPFIREKINYCFNANNIAFFSPPINVFSLVENASKENKTSFKDLRSQS